MKLTTWCSLSLGTGAEAVIEMTLCTISHGSQTPPQQGLVQNDGKPIASPQKSEWQRHADWLRKLYFIQLISMWKITEMSCRSESQSLLWWQLQRGRKNTAVDWVPPTVGKSHTTVGFLHGFAGSVCDSMAVPMPGKLQAGSAHPQLSDSPGKISHKAWIRQITWYSVCCWPCSAACIWIRNMAAGTSSHSQLPIIVLIWAALGAWMHNLGTYIRKIDVALRAVIYISISKTQA